MVNNINRIKVIGLGQASLDYLGRIPFFPAEDEKTELIDLHMQCGGPASTALVTLSRFGINTSFIGSISDDMFGIEILKGLKKEGIDTTYLKITEGYTSQVAFIAISETSGKRNIFWRRGTAPFLKPDEINLNPFKDAEILHLDGLMIDASIEAAKQAKKLGIKIVYDAGTMRQGSIELAKIVDVLIASEKFAEPVLESNGLKGPEKAIKALMEICPGDIVITLGEKGSIGHFHGRIVYQEAFSVKAVDTTGAGDVYHGAYIYGLLQDWPMPECMRFASVTAALKCRRIGAQKGIPSLNEVIDNMYIYNNSR
jgi:ribokinase